MIKLDKLAKRTRATLCLGCGKCTGTCPLSELRDEYSPRRLVARALTEFGPEAGELVRQCLTCGACEEVCPEGVEFAEFVRSARGLLPEGERAECPHHEVIHHAGRLMAGGKPGEERLAWLTPDLKTANEGKVFLFVGCLPLFDSVWEHLDLDMVGIARSAVRILNRLGIEPVVRKEEVCCGHDLFWAGDTESFTKLAEKNVALIRESGAETVITTCAECARTLMSDYKKTIPGFTPDIVHMSQFVAEHMKELGLAENLKEDGLQEIVTYHDPCRLGRHLGVYSEPRSILETLPGIRLEEMELHGAHAKCCGTSGFHHCDAESRQLQTQRLNEADATGAETLITACPKCLIHFACTQEENDYHALKGDGVAPEKKIVLKDLTTLVSSILIEKDEPATVKGDG